MRRSSSAAWTFGGAFAAYAETMKLRGAKRSPEEPRGDAVPVALTVAFILLVAAAGWLLDAGWSVWH
jgi:hypothetical protein